MLRLTSHDQESQRTLSLDVSNHLSLTELLYELKLFIAASGYVIDLTESLEFVSDDTPPNNSIFDEIINDLEERIDELTKLLEESRQELEESNHYIQDLEEHVATIESDLEMYAFVREGENDGLHK